MVDIEGRWSKSACFDFAELDDSEESSRCVNLSVAERCEREQARPVIVWAPNPGPWKGAVGVFYGLRFPWSERTLKWLGPSWLTQAFHAAGSLAEEGEVKEIVSVRSLGPRAASERILVTLDYGKHQCGMHTKLLVKFPLEDSERLSKKHRFGPDSVGPLPFLQKVDYFAEINFYRLYEKEAPFRMPKFYYGDISDKTSKFILITEWVPLPGETDDARQDGQKQLYSGEETPTLDANDVGADEWCYLVGPHGKCLGVRDMDNVAQTAIVMSDIRDENSTWILRPVDKFGKRHFLIAPRNWYLTTSGRDERALLLSSFANEEKGAWTLVDVPGERYKCFLKSPHGTYLASLQDDFQTLYMSPNGDDWEKWRRVPATPLKGAKATVEHLELRGASSDVCLELVKAGAKFAGRHKAGLLGSDEFLEQSFAPAAPSVDKLWEVDPEWKGLGDTDFIEQAAKAQEFIIQIGKCLFPEGTITAATMKGYRAMLVTTRANLRYIRWFLNCRKDYVALGHDRFDMDSAYRWHENEKTSGLGLREWEGVSIGPLGTKLWGWLRFADSDVLMHSRDALLQRFIDEYLKSGGPPLNLEDLRMHFILSAALDSVQLLNAVPEIYRCWPKNQWTSIQGLRDSRLLGQTLGQGTLWVCLKSLVNIALVLSTCDVVEVLSQVMPLVFHTVAHEATPNEEFVAGSDGAEVRASLEPDATLVAQFPAGFPLVATGRRRASTPERGPSEEYAEVKLPVYGWVAVDSLHASTAQERGLVDPRTEAASDIYERMYHSRRQYTGFTPVGMQVISTLKLVDTLHMYDKMFQCLQRFGHGDCRSVSGSFLVERHPRTWWPRGYEDWADHTFLVFDDGTIADITADQYDDVPQLWWPADASRYDYERTKADAAEAIREKIGIAKWTEHMERDKTVPWAKKRHKWWEAQHKENSHRTAPDGGPMSIPGYMRTKTNPHTAGRAQRDRTIKGAKEDSIVFLDGRSIPLPPIARSVAVGDDRPKANFRRVSKEDELNVCLVDDIFTSDELQKLVKLCEARKGFQPSLQNSSSGQQVLDNRRTSHSCTLHCLQLWGGSIEEARRRGIAPEDEEELLAAAHITELCARAMEVDTDRIEPLQLVKYTPGQFYKAHLDTHKEPDRLSSHNGEQRTHTLLVYMSDVPHDDQGGHTHFPLLGLRVLPRAGTAVFWDNLTSEGEPDPHSLHEGEPPLKCEKIAMNVWVVDRPFTTEAIVAGRQRKLRQAQEAAAANGKAVPSAAPREPLLVRKLRERAVESDDD